MAKKPFNSTFADLKRRLASREKPKTPTPTPALSGVEGPTATANPELLWDEAVRGVRPLDPGPGRVGPRLPAPGPREPRHPDLDAIDELRALVRGDAPFDLSDSEEFIEGRVAGLDPEVVRKLRRGEYAVQGHVDLHGMTREEAKAAVGGFLRASRAGGKRCVLVVHGRGTHSRDQVPILKEALRGWLGSARFGRNVLAFATARPEDGGAGAIYVLLRRPGR